MYTTRYPEVDHLLQSLLTRIQAILGQRLIGVYLYGSLVYGDFDVEISDIDLLTVIATPLDEQSFTRLEGMHQQLAAANLRWQDRIETAYVTRNALNTARTQTSTIVNISPGEPFHRLEAGKEWLVNWYMVRERGIALFGPSPQNVIDPITTAEFVEVIRSHTQQWAAWIDDCRHLGGQAYAILTLCRALYVLTYGVQVSKLQAAAWAATTFPQWAVLIEQAQVWRKHMWHTHPATISIDPEATFPETVRFVHFAITQIPAT